MAMDRFRSQERRQTLEAGEVTIKSFCSPEEIRQYDFSSRFGSHANYRSLYIHRHSLEINAAQSDANVTLALADRQLIVGFGVLTYPEPDERWAQLHPRIMMEVKAIEVSSKWRSQGLAKNILGLLIDHPIVEEKIAYMVGYSWTWDLDGSKKTAQQYRRMLIRLFEPVGFKEYQTNEPNICLKPENLFMGRVGKNVSTDVQNDFKWLRFGIGPG
jgi:acetoin utilization protein AcuA